MKKKVTEMTKKSDLNQADLSATESLLERLNNELSVLNENKKIKQAQLDELSAQAELMGKRLNAAKKLISGLSREQERWTADTLILDEKKVKLLGDCLTCSSFLSYSGPFDFNYRTKMVYGLWMEKLTEYDIPNSENFRLEELLTTDVEVSEWAS